MLKYTKLQKIKYATPFIVIALMSCQSVTNNRNQITISAEDKVIIDEYTQACTILETKINKHVSNARKMILLDEIGRANGNVNVLNRNFNEIEQYIKLSCSSKKNLERISSALGESLLKYGKNLQKILSSRKFSGPEGKAVLLRYRDIAKDMSELSGNFVTLMKAAPPYIHLLREKGIEG